MTKKGQASKALAIGMTASFIGTLFSVLIATLLSPIIADFALMLGPWEYFSLCFCAITLVAALSKGNIFKGIMAAGIGLLLGCVGLDPVTGVARFTFGTHNLDAGISTVCQMLGMFALCQVIRDYAKGQGTMPDIDASIESDYAVYNDREKIWRLDGNVRAINLRGEVFETPQLYWNQNTERIYSDSAIDISRSNSIIRGIGFDSNQMMTQYTIRKPTGVFPINEN